jgi:hypothetical protein
VATHASHLSLVLACAILAPAGRAQAPAQRTFPNAPQGFDVRREGVSRGRVDRVEYDSTVTVGGGHTVPVWKNDLYHLATLLFR